MRRHSDAYPGEEVESHRLTGALRTRWLCVWARASDPSFGFPDAFRPSTTPADPVHRFFLPPPIRDQLKLTGSELVT